MVNYNNSVIYKLCSKDTNIKDIYIGSTTNFTRRKADHKRKINDCNNKEYNYKKSVFIRDNGGWENWDMVLIEKVNCNDKLELHKIERYYIEKFKSSLNMRIPSRTLEEYNKTEIRKQKKKQNDLDYYQKNKDTYYQTTKKNREKLGNHTCECGATIKKYNLKKHLLSKKHNITK